MSTASEGTDAAAFLQSLLATVPAFILRVDVRGDILYINRVQAGSTAQQFIGSNLRDFVPPAEAERAWACVERVMQTGVPDSYEIVSWGANGRSAVYECHVSSVMEGTSCTGACLVAVDVTSQRQRERTLADTEGKLRVAREAAGIGLWSWDIKTDELVWDDKMHEICGTSLPLRFDEYAQKLVHPEDQQEIGRQARQHLQLPTWSAPPHRIVRPDGSIRWVTVSAQNEFDAEGNVVRVLGGTWDVTEQRSREDQLRRAQKLEAVGALSAGVAHNFNNVLTVIMPALDVLAASAPEDVKPLAKAAEKAAKRAAQLVRQLMTFARGGRAARPQLIDLRRPLEQTVSLCRRTFAAQPNITLHIQPDLPRVAADESEVEQVILNLLLNARDAIQEAGRATEGTITVTLACEGDRMVLSVRDNGVGMTAEVRQRIFEPFFSTKEASKGTGLGLATSYAMVREHGGDIDCESTPGGGTVFFVRWPVQR